MEDYAESIQGVDEIRTGTVTDELGLLENKVYQKFVGKLSWLAENCRPDLCVVALNMAQKCKSATLGDLMMINKNRTERRFGCNRCWRCFIQVRKIHWR